MIRQLTAPFLPNRIREAAQPQDQDTTEAAALRALALERSEQISPLRAAAGVGLVCAGSFEPNPNGRTIVYALGALIAAPHLNNYVEARDYLGMAAEANAAPAAPDLAVAPPIQA
jgi:hypothetical protein